MPLSREDEADDDKNQNQSDENKKDPFENLHFHNPFFLKFAGMVRNSPCIAF
jgi:hypothetical protein